MVGFEEIFEDNRSTACPAVELRRGARFLGLFPEPRPGLSPSPLGACRRTGVCAVAAVRLSRGQASALEDGTHPAAVMLKSLLLNSSWVRYW